MPESEEPTPAAAAAAFGVASFETGRASFELASVAEVPAAFFWADAAKEDCGAGGAGFVTAGDDAGFAGLAPVSLDCAAARAFSGATRPFAGSAFLAAGFDSLHFSRSSSSSLPFW